MESKKKILRNAVIFALMFGITPSANAMHIMEGYLPAKYCIAWGIISLPLE